METFEPTDEQRAVIEHRGTHMLVFAGPGTGKTETLARRFASIVHDDGVAAGNILVLTFSHRAADAMRQRIVQRMHERAHKGIAVPELHVYTFHSFCRRLLDGDRPRNAARNFMSPVKERLLWRHSIEGISLPTFAPDVVASSKFATEALNLIARLKGDGIGVDAFERDAAGDDRLRDLAQLYKRMHEQRSRLGLSDFRDLVVDAVRELGEPGSPASVWLRERGGFAHVLVDEFQDSDPMQLRLLEALAPDARLAMFPRTQMCFVGDFNQSIYRFRGANPKNISAAKERFACREFGLRLNRRSVQPVLDVANRTPQLLGESLTSAEPGRSERGCVRFLQTETAGEEIAAIADAVAERVRQGTPPERIAVLLRVVEPYRGAIARELEARGIPVAAQSTAGFYEDAAVDAVLSAIRLISGRRDADAWKRLLTNPLVGFRPLSVSFALDAVRPRPGDPRRALDAHPPTGRLAWDEFLKRFHACATAGGPPYRFNPAALVEAVARELDLMWPIRELREVPGFHPLASPGRLEALVTASSDIAQTLPKIGGGRLTAETFLKALDDVFSLLGDPLEGPQPGIEGVPVMSIHAAKGLEFDFVVIPQLLDGVLPARPRPDPLLGNRRAAYSERIEDAALEEASLWYVAVTRARFDVLATAARLGDDAAEQTASPYALLIPQADEAHAWGVEARSRLEPAGFTAAYGAANAQERAAEPVRRYLALRPVIAAYLQHGGLTEEPPGAIHWSVDRLSPSGIERYAECPRRWFYQHALQLPEDADDVTRMGRFVHRVLERYHATATDYSAGKAASLEASAILDEIQPILQEEAERTASSSGLTTQSSIFRYEYARISRQLAAYADWLVREARHEPFAVLAVEQRVEIPLGDIRLVSRVDRVDRREDGSLVIRDYKTGKLRTKPSGGVLVSALSALEPAAPGIGLFGHIPDGLKLQSLLYVRGVEAFFNGAVARADYLYLAGAPEEPDAIVVDSVELGDGRGLLSRADLDKVYDVIGSAIAREILSGSLTAFPTALDEQTCRYCSFTTICPGAGSIGYGT